MKKGKDRIEYIVTNIINGEIDIEDLSIYDVLNVSTYLNDCRRKIKKRKKYLLFLMNQLGHN